MQFGVSECISHWARYCGQRPAVEYNGNRLTYKEFDELVSRVATAVEPVTQLDDRVCLAAGTKLHTLVAMCGIVRAGRSVVLLNTGLSPEALGTNISDASAKLMLYEPSTVKIAKLFDPSLAEKTMNLTKLLAEREPLQKSSRFPDRSSEKEWGVFFSSGTTGTPKGIERDHHSVVTELLGWCLELGLRRDATFYIGRPVHYTGGAVLALSVLVSGGLSILNDYSDSQQFPEIWEDYQRELKRMPITWAFFIPDQARTFLHIVETQKITPSSAANILLMGAPVKGAEKRLLRDRLASEITESWGNTESLGTITEPEDVLTRPDSIGRPFLGDHLCIVDEQGIQLGPGELGFLAGGLDAGFRQYSNRPSETRQAKRFDLIISEDIGYTDENGYFYIRGRLQDSFVIGDRTFFVTDIEEQVRATNQVLECCAVLDGDPSGDLTILLLVVTRATGDIDELVPLIKGKIAILLGTVVASLRVIRVESMPRLPSGKIDRITCSRLVRVE